jgi:hypothetical protein
LPRKSVNSSNPPNKLVIVSGLLATSSGSGTDGGMAG